MRTGIHLVVIFFLSSCTSNPKKPDQPDKPEPIPVEQKAISLIKPVNGSTFKLGDGIDCEVSIEEEADSIQVSLEGGNKITLLAPFTSSIPTQRSSTGRKRLKAKVFFKDGTTATKSTLVMLKARRAPVQKSYKILSEYPHPSTHYTQGIELHGKIIYEGTGLNGKSMLTRYKLGDSKAEMSNALPYKYFGEGITLLDGKIYQLTWRSHIGFVYEAESFQKVREFQYPVEGWGLCNNGSELIMSDGTGILYFLDPNSLVEKRRMEVYDHSKAANNLNELEYIEGKIYANVYLKDLILVIDEHTGEVLEEIDMTNLLNPLSVKNEIDVLNGIAYKKDNKSFLLTGKLWPTIFEVRFE